MNRFRRTFIVFIFCIMPSVVYAAPDHDLICAEAASWALSWMDVNSAAADNVRTVSYFYLGRLSKKDSTIDWFSVMKNDLRNNRQSEDYYSDSLSQCPKEMTKMLRIPAATE
jgi:hypothetical protein